METRSINQESSSKKKKTKKKAKSTCSTDGGSVVVEHSEPSVSLISEKQCHHHQQNNLSSNAKEQNGDGSCLKKCDPRSLLDFLVSQQSSVKESSIEGQPLTQGESESALAQTSKKKKKKKKKKGTTEVASNSTDTAVTVCESNGAPIFICNPEITITPINPPKKKKKKKKKKNKSVGDSENSPSDAGNEVSLSTIDLPVGATVSSLNHSSNSKGGEQAPLESSFPQLENTKKEKSSRDVILVLDGVVVFPQLQSETFTDSSQSGVSKSGNIFVQEDNTERASVTCQAKGDTNLLNSTKFLNSKSVTSVSQSLNVHDQQLKEISSSLTIINENQTLNPCASTNPNCTVNNNSLELPSEASDKMPESVNISEEQSGSQNSTKCVLNGAVSEQQKTKAQLKAERRAAFEAQRAAQLDSKKPQGGDESQNDVQGKSKAQLRAERRALQEAQRAAKLSQKSETTEVTEIKDTSGQVSESTNHKNSSAVIADSAIAKPHVSGRGYMLKKKGVKKTPADQEQVQKTQRLQKFRPFSHLPQHQWDPLLTKSLGMSGSVIHPAIIRVGLQIAQGIICGSNARCVAMLSAFKEVIKDYVTPSHKELSRDLESMIQPYISFLARCRPLSVSMDNAVKFLKFQITHISPDMKDLEARQKLCNEIDTFIKNEIFLAREQIITFADQKINDGDVILTYACSSLVKQVLCAAHENNRKFRVIVVDARPKLEGREMLRCLTKCGIRCSYVLINAVSYIMKEVKKVILGAHSLQANGYVMSRVGSSQIALVASAYNVPVLVCCETYKFCERVHTDSFVYNELGDPDDLVSTVPTRKGILESWKEIPSLRLLNLIYDVTPPDLVAMVIYEKGMLPCTSVPVVLRVKQAVT